MTHGYEMCSVGNIANKYVIPLYGGRDGVQTYCGGHLKMYRNNESLCCITRNQDSVVHQLYVKNKQTNIKSHGKRDQLCGNQRRRGWEEGGGIG